MMMMAMTAMITLNNNQPDNDNDKDDDKDKDDEKDEDDDEFDTHPTLDWSTMEMTMTLKKSDYARYNEDRLEENDPDDNGSDNEGSLDVNGSGNN